MFSLNLIDKAFILKKSPLFSTLDLDQLLSIADKLESMHYRPSDFVFQLNQDAHRMYLIVTGQIAIFDKNSHQLADLSVGDFFGDEAMFSEKPRTYRACCKTKVELLSLTRSHLLSVIQECPTVALAFLESYSSSLSFRFR